MNEVEQLVKTTLAELKTLAGTQSVVGEPIHLGTTTIIPLVKLGFGFGAGGGTGSKAGDSGTGGGTGAGAGVKPIAVLIIDEDGVRLESIAGNGGTEPASSSTADKVLDLIKTAMDRRNSGATEEDRSESKETMEEGKDER